MTNFKISTRHKKFADILCNQRVLDHPQEFLGPNWKSILNLWIYLETLNDEQIVAFAKKFRNSDYSSYIRQLWNYCYEYSQFADDIYIVTPVGFDYVVMEITCFQSLMDKGESLRYLPLLLTL